jgi:hypothetical protein
MEGRSHRRLSEPDNNSVQEHFPLHGGPVPTMAVEVSHLFVLSHFSGGNAYGVLEYRLKVEDSEAHKFL